MKVRHHLVFIAAIIGMLAIPNVAWGVDLIWTGWIVAIWVNFSKEAGNESLR